jgi:hypothetical protein
MQKLTKWQLKTIPVGMAKPLRYAVQHFLSIHTARMETEDSLMSAAILPAIRETLSAVDSQTELAEMLNDTKFTFPAFDASQIAVLEMAIVEWAVELAEVDSNAPIKREAMALVREWDNAKWRDAK